MVLATGALTALFYLPAVIGSGVHAVVANRFVVPLPWHSFTHQIGSSLSATWNDWNRDISIVGAVTFAAFFLLGAARARADLPFVVAVWCGVLVIEQRWVPFPRIWTFAIPVYWMSVSAGVDAVIRNKRWIQAIALTVCISIGVATLVSGSVLTSRDTGYFPDAERVALALRDLRASDRVLAYLEGDAPLEYYAGLHEEKLPIGAIRPTDSRLFIVVDRAAGQTLASVAAHFRSRFANVASLEHAAPWKHFARADIYVYERA
jgi:hypothetical protein